MPFNLQLSWYHIKNAATAATWMVFSSPMESMRRIGSPANAFLSILIMPMIWCHHSTKEMPLLCCSNQILCSFFHGLCCPLGSIFALKKGTEESKTPRWIQSSSGGTSANSLMPSFQLTSGTAGPSSGMLKNRLHSSASPSASANKICSFKPRTSSWTWSWLGSRAKASWSGFEIVTAQRSLKYNG